MATPCSGPQRALLYFHTLRHLKPIQVLGRVRYRWQGLHLRATPPSCVARHPVSGVVPFPARDGLWLGEGRLRFLNVEGQALEQGDWEDASKSQLWLYNLHYFHWLQDPAAAGAPPWRLIRRWIAHNPLGHGEGWRAYPLSLRIVSWIKHCLGQEETPQDVVDSLALQCAVLSQRVEYHLLGNHLFVNGKALVWAGLFLDPGGPWLELGLRILTEQIPAQVRLDGSNVEQSPMYHAIFLEDLLDLINLLRAYGREVPEGWEATAQRMLRFLLDLCHPDGEIAFFNDTALGVAVSPRALVGYAQRLGLAAVPGPESVLFPQAGFARVVCGDAVLLADGGPNGPDHIVSHVHADSLSFELSYRGQRTLVNSGVSEYGHSPERVRQRGTPAHNTVDVDGLDQSEVWQGFRVARRARPLHASLEQRGDGWVFSGAHDGYCRLRYPVVHSRELRLTAAGLRVIDQLTGRGEHASTVHLHLHPDLTLERAPDGAVAHLRDEPWVRFTFDSGASWRIEPSTWHPEFGRVIPTSKLVVQRRGPLPQRIETQVDFL